MLVRLSAFALVLGLVGFSYEYFFNTAFRQTMNGMVAGADPKGAFGGRDAVTLMVLGKDEDRDNRDQVLKTNARSDTIILARLDFASKSIQMVSIPRDTRVHIPGTRGWSKINAAHSIGGPDLTARTLHDFLGVTPDSSFVVDYRLLQNVIDDIGGVTVHVDKRLDYDDDWGNLHIHLSPGVHTLNGRDAMGFVRFRHANDGGGDSDFVRIGRQQELVQAVKSRLYEPATWMHIPTVLETVRREMKGTLTYPQLMALANFARSVPRDHVSMHTLPSHTGRTFVYPDAEAAHTLVASIFPVDPDADSRMRVAALDRPGEGRGRRRRRHHKTVVVATSQPVAAASSAVVPITAATDQPATDAPAPPAPETDTPPAPEKPDTATPAGPPANG